MTRHGTHAGDPDPAEELDRRVDDVVRRLALPTDVQAAAVSDPQWRHALVEEITSMEPARTSPVRHLARRWRSPRFLAGVGAVTGVCVAAGAWSVTQLVGSDSLYANCYLDQDREGVAVASGEARAGGADPVERCRQLWLDRQSQGPRQIDTELGPAERAELERLDALYAGPPPEMSAYTDPDGTIVVVPDGWTLPPGLTPADEIAVDDRRARLEAALGDEVDGPPSRCLSSAEAAAVVEAELDRLDLADWRLDDVPDADGSETCVSVVYPDEGGSRVVRFGDAQPSSDLASLDVAAVADPAARGAYEAVARLRAELADAGCQSLAEASGLTRSVLETGQYTEVGDESMACATVDVVMGGDFLVTIYGPAAAAG